MRREGGKKRADDESRAERRELEKPKVMMEGEMGAY